MGQRERLRARNEHGKPHISFRMICHIARNVTNHPEGNVGFAVLIAGSQALTLAHVAACTIIVGFGGGSALRPSPRWC